LQGGKKLIVTMKMNY